MDNARRKWRRRKVEQISGEWCGAYRVTWPDSLVLLAEAGDLGLADRGSLYVLVDGAQVGLMDAKSRQMSSTVWGTLPAELVEKVVEWLPAASLIRFRAVCKRWNAMLCCDKFLELCEGSRGKAIPRCLCVFGAGQHVARRDESFNTVVVKMSLSFLPQDGIDLYPRDSAGGLLCMADASNSRMFVCNPLTKRWVELPEIGIGGLRVRAVSLIQKDCVRMKVDELTGAFMVVFGCYYNSTCGYCFHIYDPKVGYWSKSGDVRRDRGSYHDGVIHWDQLYCLDTGSPELLEEFDLREKVVTHLHVQGLDHFTSQIERSMPGTYYFTNSRKFQNRLVELGGVLYMVEVFNQRCALSCRIWRLEQSESDYTWTTVARLPRYLSFTLPQSECSWSVACTDDSICLDICICKAAAIKGQQAKSMDSHSVVCYNPQTGMWLTACNYLMNQDLKNLNRSRMLLSYRPRLRYRSLA